MNRHTILLALILLHTTGTLSAQDQSDYLLVMAKQKQIFSTARTEQDFFALASNFERISLAQPTELYPLYYTALSYIHLSFTNTTNAQKKGSLDIAQSYIDKALEIHPDESELHVLQALLYQGRIQTGPEGRAVTFLIKAEKSLELAEDYDPDNPRIYYLLGLNELHKPASAGGDPLKSCALFNKALDAYENYIPPHILAPIWGSEQCLLLRDRNCPEEK